MRNINNFCCFTFDRSNFHLWSDHAAQKKALIFHHGCHVSSFSDRSLKSSLLSLRAANSLSSQVFPPKNVFNHAFKVTWSITGICQMYAASRFLYWIGTESRLHLIAFNVCYLWLQFSFTTICFTEQTAWMQNTCQHCFRSLYAYVDKH